eukprot:20793-Karenia_brevis.AAC.2
MCGRQRRRLGKQRHQQVIDSQTAEIRKLQARVSIPIDLVNTLAHNTPAANPSSPVHCDLSKDDAAEAHADNTSPTLFDSDLSNVDVDFYSQDLGIHSHEHATPEHVDMAEALFGSDLDLDDVDKDVDEDFNSQHLGHSQGHATPVYYDMADAADYTVGPSQPGPCAAISYLYVMLAMTTVLPTMTALAQSHQFLGFDATPAAAAGAVGTFGQVPCDQPQCGHPGFHKVVDFFDGDEDACGDIFAAELCDRPHSSHFSLLDPAIIACSHNTPVLFGQDVLLASGHAIVSDPLPNGHASPVLLDGLQQVAISYKPAPLAGHAAPVLLDPAIVSYKLAPAHETAISAISHSSCDTEPRADVLPSRGNGSTALFDSAASPGCHASPVHKEKSVPSVSTKRWAACKSSAPPMHVAMNAANSACMDLTENVLSILTSEGHFTDSGISPEALAEWDFLEFHPDPKFQLLLAQRWFEFYEVRHVSTATR